ncbi:MAG: hypothetical protein OWR52_07800 [Acidibacillus sp.]|nr:hypothetical protein [Acidibacillus sp.]
MASRRFLHIGMVLVFVLFWLFPSEVSRAATSTVNMSVGVGFQSYYDPNVWVPVRVVLAFSGKKSIQGNIVYHVARKYPYEGTMEWPITLRPHQTNVVTVGVPGELLRLGGDITFQYHGAVYASAHMIGISVEGSDVAGVVSDHPQSVQFLAGVSSANGTSELVTAYINPKALPPSVQLLQTLRYIYIDGSAAAELHSSQVKALEDWVRSGGILVLGGVEPNAGQIGLFSRLSPVNGSIVLDGSGSQLASFAGSTPLHSSLALLYGQAKQSATVLVGSTSQALIADAPLGRGEVVYVGFDASSPVLVSWSGNALLWDAISRSLHSAILEVKPDLFGQNGTLSIMGAAEQFPQLHSPPLWIWEITFGLYTFICGPALYIILRRRRKNEWAWFVLPLIAFVVAGAIYEMGVLQRPNGILTQNVGLVDIFDDHLAQTVGVEALMSPQMRSYSIVTPPSTWSVALAEEATGYADDGRVSFLHTENRTTFSHVRAWGGRFVYSVHEAHHFGNMDANLYSTGNTIAGDVVNDTRVNFSDAALVKDGQVIDLGPIKRGEVIDVDAMLRSNSTHHDVLAGLSMALQSASYGVGHALFGDVGSFVAAKAPQGDVLFIGWTHDEPNLFNPLGTTLPATPQWIVRQVLPVMPVVE